MKQKGFTLVELLCVIIIIAVISIVVFPMVASYINKSKDELYEVQVKDIEDSAKKWALDNIDKLDKYHINDTYVTLQYIKQKGYLEKDEILNPRNKETMEGCVLIKYDNTTKQYNYEYDEIDCTNESTDLDSESYVVYSYDDDKAQEVINDQNKKVPFYQTLLDNNNLKVLGETDSGLYDLDNEYVFKGDTVNNYVKYDGKNWRILNIDKNDYSIRLISLSGSSSLWSSENITDYSISTLKDTLASNLTEDLKLYDVWNNGVVPNSEMSSNSLKSSLTASTINVKAGLISIYDYILASTSSNCNSNFLSSECKNNNYLTTMFSGNNVWTMNTDGTKIWYINSTGSLGLQNSSSATYYVYTVIQLPINVFATNASEATGSDINFAYILN